MLPKDSCAAGPLRSAGVTPLRRYYGPSRHRLVVSRFPGAAGYTAYYYYGVYRGKKAESRAEARAEARSLWLAPYAGERGGGLALGGAP